MVAGAGAPFRSANAGELSEEAAGRNDLKQFYSAGLRFKGCEPTPISGFRNMAGSVDVGVVRGRVVALGQSAVAATPGPFVGTAVIWQATVSGIVAAIDCAALVATVGNHALHAEVLMAGVWKPLGSTVSVDTNGFAMTLAAAPGEGLLGTAIRLVSVFSVAASITTGVVTVFTETAVQDVPRYASLAHDSGARYFMSLQPGWLDIFENDTFVASCSLPTVTLAVLPQVNFYAENATLGLFHRKLQTLRVRRSGASLKWVRDLWPYVGIPKVDLGGTYVKTDDKWETQIKYTGSPFVYLTLVVNGETTPGIPFVDVTNTPVAIGGAVDASLTAVNIKTALELLPSLGATVTVVITSLAGLTKQVAVTFGGALSGKEYQFVSNISNTADAAALSSHIQIGKTDFEPIVSTVKGWVGVVGLASDRLAYGDIDAVQPAISMSQAGEYFNLNIEASGPSAARLDKLRAGQVSERVLNFAEATYFLVFTNKAVHFAANRTINATDALNYTEVSASGIVPNCNPVKIESKIYYVGVNPKADPPTGHQLLSLAYSELETTFEPTPEHILAPHLVNGIIRSEGQKAASKADASKIWMLRDDGRVVAANIIRSQEVLGFCEWVLAASGLAKEMTVDDGNDLRLCVSRNGHLRHERLDAATLFQTTVTRTADLAGRVNNLNLHEGREVWAQAEGYVLGPFTVAGGAIDLEDAYMGDVQVGLWQAPLMESMPRYMITRNDEIITRPGRIHTIYCKVIDTTSIAIGANDGAPENVPLQVTGDLVGAPLLPFTGALSRAGILGFKLGTTYVITQTRPGKLHVRDILVEEKL